ncbi:hypothetical protein ACCQ08_25000 [Comamonas sp. SY3]|uniref:hypothetical protein n=1 Tax=Comamonas sp. SY3 TaxID=3243601 RepID=UPI003593BDFE
MSADDFQNLKDSIAEIGVQNPITLFEGMVLDGWHRYNAANEVLMPCPHVELAAGTDPRHFVLAQNKARRHVTQAQLAMATTAVYDWKPAHREKAHIECELPAKTNAELAAIAGVHANTITQAKAVQTKAAPEVVEAVKRGDIGLPKAAAIAKLPKEEQAAAIGKPIPKKEPEADVFEKLGEVFGPSEEELRAHELQEQADRAALDKLMESDDKLETAYAEIKRLNAVNSVLESRMQGLMNEKAEAIKLVKARDRQIVKLEAMLKESV